MQSILKAISGLRIKIHNDYYSDGDKYIYQDTIFEIQMMSGDMFRIWDDTNKISVGIYHITKDPGSWSSAITKCRS